MRGSDFAELRAFAEVAGQGSFSRAAQRLRMAPSTLSQTIRALERRLMALHHEAESNADRTPNWRAS